MERSPCTTTTARSRLTAEVRASLTSAAGTYTTSLTRRLRMRKMSQSRLFRTSQDDGTTSPTQVAHIRLPAPHSENENKAARRPLAGIVRQRAHEPKFLGV